MAWQRVCAEGAAPEGLKQFETAGGDVLLVRKGETIFACQAVCPHLDTPLEEGFFDGEVLTCHQHLWQWNLADGGEAQGLAEMPLETYPLKNENGELFVDLGG